jgi:hypothetical protein
VARLAYGGLVASGGYGRHDKTYMKTSKHIGTPTILF